MTKRIKLPRSWLYIIFGCIALIIMRTWQFYYTFFSHPVNHQIQFELPPQSNAKTFANILKNEGFISNVNTFRFFLRFLKYSHQLKSGYYQVNPQDTVWMIVQKVVKGDIYKVPFRIIEGMRFCELISQLEQSKDYIFHSDMLLPFQKENRSMEGLLFASTYWQPYHQSIQPVLKQAYDMLQTKLDAMWNEREPDLPYKNSYEMLIAASIIEKETADPDERKLIAGVLVNRLRIGMGLQMDPTVAYALPGCKHALIKKEDLKINSLYNTYKYRGLPPTPIAMVGMSALVAAAHPTKSKYFYYVAKGDGHHTFSENYVGQKQAVKTYLKDHHRAK